MLVRKIFCKFGLIGEDLELKKNVSLDIDENGVIKGITFESSRGNMELSSSGRNFLMVPGFINSHVHVGDNFTKELGFNKGLIETVAPPQGLKHLMLQKSSKEVKVTGIQKAALEMLSNGITYFIDFREGGVSGIRLLKEALDGSPIKYLCLGRFNDIEEIEGVFQEADGIGLSSYKKTSVKINERLKHFKQNLNKIIACHSAEVRRDDVLLAEIIKDDIIDVIVHGTQYIKEDLEKLKKSNIALVLCPRSNGYFGVGFPPIKEILRLKMTISLGTDNLMVNSSDLFEEMRYLYRVSRVLANNNDDGAALSAKTLLKMVTINAARNFGIDGQVGSISKGKKADFFLIDLDSPNLYCQVINQENLYSLLFQRTTSNNIIKTYINGVVVSEKR